MTTPWKLRQEKKQRRERKVIERHKRECKAAERKREAQERECKKNAKAHTCKTTRKIMHLLMTLKVSNEQNVCAICFGVYDTL